MPAVLLWTGFLVSVANADVVFCDHDFAPSDWSVEVVHSVGGSAVSVIQATAGGNPDEYQEGQLTLDHSTFHVAVMFSSAVHNPATQGAIQTANLRTDVRLVEDTCPCCPNGTTNIFAAVKQDGRYYSTFGSCCGRFGSTTPWFQGLMGGPETTYNEAVSGTLDLDSHPDFSTSGSPIQFGYFVIGWCFGGGGSRTWGVDNYFMMVTTVPGAKPGSILFSASCFGAACPCGNEGCYSCANSTGEGGRLLGSGSRSVSMDDLLLSGTLLPPNNSGLFYMGDTVAGNPFFDGKQCALGTTYRFLDAIQNTGASGTMSLGPGIVAGSSLLIDPGESWHFHAWYRDVPGSPCGTGANLTNLYSVTFTP